MFPQFGPLNDRRRAARTLSKIVNSCVGLRLFFPRLLIFLLFLMSGNIHLYSDPIFYCSECASNVTYRSRSVQYCTCSKWVHLGCIFLLLSLTSSPSPIPEAVRLATSRPLLGVPNSVTPSHFLRSPPARISPLFTTIHPKISCQCNSSHSPLLTNFLTFFFFVLTPPASSQLSFTSPTSSTFCFFHTFCFL